MPLATVPQGNEESRGGRRGEGEKKGEKERKKGNVIFHGDCPKSLPVLYIATHIQKVAHTQVSAILSDHSTSATLDVLHQN